MSHPALESFRNALVAAQLSPEPALRRLALGRYDHAWRAITAGPAQQRAELHARLFGMLPSDWPLWVERYRARPVARLSQASAG